jgi:hypothetical protein
VPKVQLKTNTKIKKGSRRKEQRKPKCSLVWRTGLSGVPPDNVRCTTGQCLVHQGGTTSNSSPSGFQAHLRYNSPDCPVSQRSNGYLRATVDSDSEQCITVHVAEVRADGQSGTGLSGVAPDCPVSHEDKASNGRPAPTLTNRMTWRRTEHCPVAHRTVRWRTGLFGAPIAKQPSPTATIWLVAINTTPTGHFKVWEPKRHSKSSS